MQALSLAFVAGIFTAFEPRQVSLVILTALIGLTVAAMRKVFRQSHAIMVIGGTSVLLGVLAVLTLAYLITYRAV
ncbi:unnamed protein product [[Actinomadura] parvosata subsp. kistnae]|uniref:Uncharacterized protein n=2 Tax=Nonomuraea TaxID=83681 RepID=A0A1V0A7J1_9ACTN|nr:MULTISPECIES: hypothetical protein [unclassified Nonomuraea]AQZ66174.1 hypothetical protein BKM31_36175 [Nonomuraea sp. ATCC 55076]NJP92163.1 hypothetical protein [Nonomuraea sp. FMUSA5-5]SPL97679.1 unnamed protein product [Actinomadura parvosata subsp. kistnae]